jgi:hypothetical protein
MRIIGAQFRKEARGESIQRGRIPLQLGDQNVEHAEGIDELDPMAHRVPPIPGFDAHLRQRQFLPV